MTPVIASSPYTYTLNALTAYAHHYQSLHHTHVYKGTKCGHYYTKLTLKPPKVFSNSLRNFSKHFAALTAELKTLKCKTIRPSVNKLSENYDWTPPVETTRVEKQREY